MQKPVILKKRSFRASVILMAVVAIALMLVFMPPKLMAAKAVGCHTEYFEDECHSYTVGYKYEDCQGNLIEQWGDTCSIYYTYSCNCPEN